MWRLLFALIGLSITGVTSFSQRPPGAEGLALTRPSPTDAGYFGGTGVVRFQLIQGRLRLDAPRHRKGSQSCQAEDVYESITVTADRGLPSLHYVCQSPQQHLTLSVRDAATVRIESWLQNSSERSSILQSNFGDLAWEIKRTGDEQTIIASTLLHLRQQQPETFDAHFGDLITRILQGTSLENLSARTHDSMLTAITQKSALFSVDDVAKCVEGLRSPRRQDRAKSEKQILMWGTPVLATLSAIPTDNLDAEQLDRLRYIRRCLRTNRPDTPGTLARLLINDHRYWSSIAGQLSDSNKQMAETHLQGIGFKVALGGGTPTEQIATK